MAQIAEVLSVGAVVLSFTGAGILAFRKYSSVTGALFLAALGTIGGECGLLTHYNNCMYE